VAVGRVAQHLGCTPEDAKLRIIDAGIKDHIKARGMVDGRPVSPLSTAWRGTVDLAGMTMRPPEASWQGVVFRRRRGGVVFRRSLDRGVEIANLQLCSAYLVASGLLTTPAFEREWWTAAEALAWIIMGVPLAWEEWEGLPELVAKMEWAGRELARVIGEGVRAQGSLKPKGEKQPLPGSDLRIPGFKWRVGPEGDLGTSPPGPLGAFEGRRWYGIEVDSATLREALPRLRAGEETKSSPKRGDRDGTPTKTRHFNARSAARFADTFIRNEEKKGNRPTLTNLDQAVRKAGYRGGTDRDLVREEFRKQRKAAGHEVKQGPLKKSAE
jgi:hypothetical protein